MRISEISFFYINCQKDSFKNKLMLTQWNECCAFYDKNVILNRFDAVHYLDYSSAYYTNTYSSEKSKIDGQLSNIAVFKSHTNLWKYIWDKNIKYAFIFEDDVIIPKTFLKDLENILDTNFNYLLQKNWDILYFGILRMMAKKTENDDFNRVLNKKGYNNGLHSYFVNHDSLGKLIGLITRTGALTQIDILLRDNADDFDFYVYKELLIKQNVDQLESTRLGRFVKDELKANFNEINIIS